MSDATQSVPSDDGALARRIFERRARGAAPTTETTPSGDDSPLAKPMEDSIVETPPSVQNGLGDRIAVRRAKNNDVSTGNSGSGEGESGSVGKHIAREPLFAGLGFPMKHGGAIDPNAPPVKHDPMDRPREDLGTPAPKPERSRSIRP